MAIGTSANFGMAHRFTLYLIEARHDLGSWAQVQGLEVSWDQCEYRAGDADNYRWYTPGVTKYPTVKLTRAACEESGKVKTWLDQTSFAHKSGELGVLTMKDANDKPVMTWELRNLLPLKWSITGFDASQSKMALETLELAHVGFLDEVKGA
ncbi:phage tail protein [Lentzea sp. NEAU-D7]|uniref:phage tail protein n=1 Tax=Lentzea sp. NEAU-D7 TaxID=2994667 RepID=UPI00224AA465|nr:phage tail protein [Lentzea sp. NEAU-D7]MCX2954579.1 phage tail protein [Lentzea sp. NEAU-D7]